MSDEKLKKLAVKLGTDVKTLFARVDQVERIRAVARDGRDGAIGAQGERGERGQPGERGVQGIPGRDGRDGLPGPKGDSVTRVEVEPGNRLAVWIGEIKTLAGQIVTLKGDKGDKGDKGADGKPGAKGDKGTDGAPGSKGDKGTSITDIKLDGNNLFVWLDGVKKSAGQILFPAVSVGGGGGSKGLLALLERSLPSNRRVINSTGDWPPVADGVVPLPSAHYYIGSNDVEILAPLKALGNVYISGAPGVSRINYAGAGAILSADSPGRFLIADIDIDAPTAQLLNIVDGTNQTIVNVLNTTGTLGSLGVVDDVLGVTLSLCNFTGLDTGLAEAGTTTSVLSVSQVFLQSASPTFRGFDFGTNAYRSLEIANVVTIAPPGASLIYGAANSANVLPGFVASIESCEADGGCAIEGGGIVQSDIRYRFKENSPLADTYEDALASIDGNTAQTTVTTGVFTKFAGTWVSSAASHFTVAPDGTITYIGERPLRSPIDFKGSVDVAAGTNKTLELRLFVNNAPVGVAVPVKVDATDPKPVTVIWQHDFQQGDFLDIRVRNTLDTTKPILRSGVNRVR